MSLTTSPAGGPMTITMVKRLTFVSLLLSSFCVGYRAFTIQPKTWQYKNNLIGYEEAHFENNNNNNSDLITTTNTNDPILLLNGFGVGSFHQHRLIPHLLSNLKTSKSDEERSDDDRSRIIYGVDYLGQGRSWPLDCNDGNADSEKGLIYSIDTWANQIIDFIEHIILPNHQSSKTGTVKVHLVGNSVGGHLSVILAVRRPDLIQSITLLNATPVWGLNLPGWSGHLPPPALPRKIGRYLFDWIRDERTIVKYLDTAYAKREAFDEELVSQIRACTEGKGGHAAFASILWSPPATIPETTTAAKDFYSKLAQVQCDVLLVFGKNDPWCKPAFAKKMVQTLYQSSFPAVHRYVELSNVGHCPNHEAPQAVGKLVARWVSVRDRSKENLVLMDGEKEEVVYEPWGEVVVCEPDEKELDLSLMDRIVATMVG